MSASVEQLKFYKGLEAGLPKEDIEIGALYHCTDTGNTYRGVSDTEMQLFSTVNQPIQTITFELAENGWEFDSSTVEMKSEFLALGQFINYNEDTNYAVEHNFNNLYDSNGGDVYEFISTNPTGAPIQYFNIPHWVYFNNDICYLLDAIPYPPSHGIRVGAGHTSDAYHLYDEDNRMTPVLVGVMENYEQSDDDVTAFINRERPIEANVEQGSISAPGGLFARGINDDMGYYQAVHYSSQGIQYEGQNGFGYNIYLNDDQIKMRADIENGLIFEIRPSEHKSRMYTCLSVEGSDEEGVNGVESAGNVITYSDFYAPDNIEGNLRRIPHTYYGTTVPDPNLGVDGDIYIMYS